MLLRQRESSTAKFPAAHLAIYQLGAAARSRQLRVDNNIDTLLLRRNENFSVPVSRNLHPVSLVIVAAR
jgi:hypothetical protein